MATVFYIPKMEKRKMNNGLADIELMKKRGTAIFGNRGSGKSNLSKLLIRQLIEQNVTVKVFDPSQTHTQESDIKHYQVIRPHTDLQDVYDNPYQNMIFDTSRLYPTEQKIFISLIMASDFLEASEVSRSNWLCHIVEECQLVLNSSVLRSKEGQEALRWVTTGRNFKLTYLIVSQRPSLVSTTAISLTGCRYFGQLDEPNDLSKLKKFIRNKEILASVPDLKVGQFVVKMSEPKIIDTPLYKCYRKPISYSEYLASLPQPKPKGFWAKLKEALQQ